MKCSLCGLDFDEKAAEPACKCCPMAKGCELARCPNCGFEMPISPDWIKKLGNKLRRWRHDADR